MGLRYIGECRLCTITSSSLDPHTHMCQRCQADPVEARRRRAKNLLVAYALRLACLAGATGLYFLLQWLAKLLR